MWKRAEEITSLGTKIDKKALALALRSQVSFVNAEWDELKVNEYALATLFEESISSNLSS